MNIKKLSLIIAAAGALIFSVGVYANWWSFFDLEDNKKTQKIEGEFTTLTWQDLVPDDFVQPENPLASMTPEEVDILLDGSDESNARLQKMQDDFNYAPVVKELNGKRVRLPAYVTPLEFDGQTKMSEFLLVPYYGACMHSPPPPANQVVHANSDETIEIKSMYDAVWAIGTIYSETVQSDIAESGYRIEIEAVIPYEEDKGPYNQ